MKRSFVEADFDIVVEAYPSSRDSNATVDQLAIILLGGDQEKAVAFLAKLKERYLGKPLKDWLSA